MTSLKLKFLNTWYNVTDKATVCYLDAALVCPILVGHSKFKVFKGVARLKPGDASDVELAKRIARAKAERAAYKAYKTAVMHTVEYYEAILQDLQEFVDKANYIVEHNGEYIQKEANTTF